MISANELMNVYHQIYNEKDRFWSESIDQPYYILSSICDLIHKLAIVPIKNLNDQSATSYTTGVGFGGFWP